MPIQNMPAHNITAKKLTCLDHPLVYQKLSVIRDKSTPSPLFRQVLREIGWIMGYAACADMPLRNVAVETPVTPTTCKKIDSPVTIVSILRAGLGMADGIREIIPFAKEGHIGIYRDTVTKLPKEYFAKLPDLPGRILLVDPMLATGGSAIHAIDVLKNHGAKPENITFLVLIAAPEGVKAFHRAYPEVPIITAALDDHLNEKSYIVPGLGDAGDRIYGTE